MSTEIELLTEIRDLLQLIAEPQLAIRDQRLRAALREVVGNGRQKQAAVTLMDGTRTQAEISKEAGINSGNLSRLVKALAAEKLVAADEERLRLLVLIPPTFFSEDSDDE